MADLGKKFGKRIQELRKMRGLTQAQFAELLDVEIVTISRIETGNRFPQKENLESIAKILNVDIKELFDFEHHEAKTELLKNIREMIKKATLDDLKYIYRMIKLYFEIK